MEKIKSKAEKSENMDWLEQGEQWYYSWDNDKVHKGADLTEVGIEEGDRFYLPELSSDMHKVVEHIHAWLQGEMSKWLCQQDKQSLTVGQCKDELKRLFHNVLQTESIQRDVETLKETYEAVVLADGGYVKKARR